MVRETRHLWVGNLPDNIREEKIREHFKRLVLSLEHIGLSYRIVMICTYNVLRYT